MQSAPAVMACWVVGAAVLSAIAIAVDEWECRRRIAADHDQADADEIEPCEDVPGVITIHGDLADEIAELQTRILSLPPEVRDADPDERARNPLVLRRVLAAVRRL